MESATAPWLEPGDIGDIGAFASSKEVSLVTTLSSKLHAFDAPAHDPIPIATKEESMTSTPLAASSLKRILSESADILVCTSSSGYAAICKEPAQRTVNGTCRTQMPLPGNDIQEGLNAHKRGSPWFEPK
jgi:hypothetical protein